MILVFWGEMRELIGWNKIKPQAQKGAEYLDETSQAGSVSSTYRGLIIIHAFGLSFSFFEVVCFISFVFI